MSTKLIDLSMEVYQGMMTYPNVTKPVIVEMESHREMAHSVGADQFGVDEITNHCMIVTGDHVGTHIDSRGHIKPDAPRAEGIPIELCYGDGVVLDLTHKGPGEEITPADIEEAERKLGGYRIKPLDIVLLRTDAAKLRFDKRYLTDHPGNDEGGGSLTTGPRGEGHGHRRHRLRPAGGQDVRTPEILGSSPRDARAGVLSLGEPV